MDISEGLQWADRIATVAQIALFVGCPTAGLTYVAARVVITQGTKLIAKRVAMAAVAGITATAAASLLSGGEGEGPGGGPTEITASDLTREEFELVVSLNESDEPELRDGDRKISIDDLEDWLSAQVENGKLKKVQCRDQLPEEQWVNWRLKLMEISQEIEQGFPYFEFTIVESTEANE